MKIRNLSLKDAPLMLEWMHDPDVVKDLQANFAAKTLEDCRAFIESAQDTSANLHMSITDDNDEYMGTVSLKHIRAETAEFGITIRKAAMGKGLSQTAMAEIITYGFDKLGLKCVYWCVNPLNTRAVKFYDKNGYQRIDVNRAVIRKDIDEIGAYTNAQIEQYIWYCVLQQ